MVNNILIEVLSSQAEQERLTIRKRQAEGIAIEKAEGKIQRWKAKKIDEAQSVLLYDKYMHQGISKVGMAKEPGVSRPTLDRIVKRHAVTARAALENTS